MNHDAVIKQLVDALEAAEAHLDWIGWGDSYERECAREAKVPEQITKALEAGLAALLAHKLVS